jgi:DNA (cytosine-5)-methyltransferase 1
MHTVAYCESDPFCRSVIAKHWPYHTIFDDIQTLTWERVRNVIPFGVEVICGGFPCQDISSAADAPAGIDGERSGLWRHFARLIGEIRPRFAIVENVADLTVRGLGRVLGDLAALGYDAEWHCIPASAVGAPHPRDRIWIVAYTPEVFGEKQLGGEPRRILSRDGFLSLVEDEGRGDAIPSWWATEPGVARVVHGIPNRVDRFGCLSNAVVPQIPEIIGRSIMRAYALSSPN